MATIRERDGRWQALVRVKVGGVVIHSETKTFDSEPLARDWAARLEAKIKTGGVSARQRSKITFGDLIAKFRVARGEAKPLGRAMQGDLDMLDRHLGAMSLEALTSAEWVKFARMRRSNPNTGGATVLHNLSVARSVLSAARPMFDIDTDSSAVSRAIKALSVSGHVYKPESRDRRASDVELEALCQDFRRIAPYPSTIIPMEVIVRVLVHLPRRVGEICDMTWADYQGGVITLRDTKHPRRQRIEHVPVPPKARALIEALPRIDARILPYKSESISASFDRACGRLHIEDLHLHDLRHEGICRLFESGLSIPQVAMVSGHLSWNMLRRYTHLKPQDVLEEMDARS